MRVAVLVTALLLASCGSKPGAPKPSAPNPSIVPVTACAGIIPRVVAVSDFNPTRITSIIEPVTLGQSKTELSCRGSALAVNRPERYPLWFRQSVDATGAASIQYSDRPFPK